MEKKFRIGETVLWYCYPPKAEPEEVIVGSEPIYEESEDGPRVRIDREGPSGILFDGGYILVDELEKKEDEPFKLRTLRPITHSELELMMTRLVLKVQEEPEWFDGWANGKLIDGVRDFIDGEHMRRHLFLDDEEVAGMTGSN